MKIENFLKINMEAKKTMDYSPFDSFDEFWIMIKSKNHTAWEIIQNQFSKIMHCYLNKKGIPQLDAEDMIQTAYMKFWKKILEGKLTFNDSKSLLVYLLRICERETIQYLRSKMKKVIGISFDNFDPKEITDEIIDEVCIDDRIEARKIIRFIIETLEKRPHEDDHLKIFEDYYFKGLDMNEIAQNYKKTPNNIRVILHRQRMFLLSKLK